MCLSGQPGGGPFPRCLLTVFPPSELPNVSFGRVFPGGKVFGGKVLRSGTKEKVKSMHRRSTNCGILKNRVLTTVQVFTLPREESQEEPEDGL